MPPSFHGIFMTFFQILIFSAGLCHTSAAWDHSHDFFKGDHEVVKSESLRKIPQCQEAKWTLSEKIQPLLCCLFKLWRSSSNRRLGSLYSCTIWYERYYACSGLLIHITHPSWRIVRIWPIPKTNGLYPAILWYFRYPKQERSKFFNQDFFCNRDFKIPHFSLLFLLHSDITAWSFQRNFCYFPCQLWQDVLREL